jgi:hypothetical protein
MSTTLNQDSSVTPARSIRRATFGILVAGLLLVWVVALFTPGGSIWIHLLPLVALLALFTELRTRGTGKNIDAVSGYVPHWNPAEPEESLAEIYRYVLDEATRSTSWYWRHKGNKAVGSQLIRFAVWALATLGGLLPVLAAVFKDYVKDSPVNLQDGLCASLLLGLAAALVGLDKGFGFSSGWARYVLTGTSIRKSLEDFRLDWTGLRAKAGSPLTSESVAPMIERAKQFRSEVEGLVLQETKDWVTEFQSTMAQMEKDVAAQLSSLKAQVDKTLTEKAAITQPGYIELTLADPNNHLGNATLTVRLVDSNNEPVKGVPQQPLTSLTWTSPFVPPGLYQVKVEGSVNQLPLAQTRDATVKSGERASATPVIQLP